VQVQRVGAQQLEAESMRVRTDQLLNRVRDEYGSRELQLVAKLEKLTQILTAKDKQYQVRADVRPIFFLIFFSFCCCSTSSI
jgi:hypothetical protein